ncbi:MAG: hypothetical protein HY691_17625 [Chloroflexi bacterium]|nr:hypothetical protein [Chloroflexota bacterium]
MERPNLGEVLRHWRRARQPTDAALSLAPRSTFEAVTRQQVEDLRRELSELRNRVNALLFGIAATFLAVLVDLAVRR